MSLGRRKFLLAASSALPGLILPSFYERAVAFLENHGEPLLEAPPRVDRVLEVHADYGDLFSFGPPLVGPPVLTWRQVIERYHAGFGQYLMDNYDLEPSDLDCEADEDSYLDDWYSKDSPYARAAAWLESHGFGSRDGKGRVVGGIVFDDDVGMGGCATFKAFAQCPNSVALLQHQINERGLGVKLALA